MTGVAAAAVAVGVAQLVGAAFGPQADVRTAVGSAVIELTPGAVKEWAIDTFGTADKLALTVMVLAVIAVIAAVAGILESRRRPIGSTAIVAAGGVGCAAVLSRAGATLVDIVPTLVGTACGVAVLRLLVSGRFTDEGEEASTDQGRRLSLVTLGLLGAGVASGALGVVITRLASSVSGDREAFALPKVNKVGPHPGRGAAERCCAAVVRHEQLRLLPHRHRVERPTTEPAGLAVADPRHGGP